MTRRWKLCLGCTAAVAIATATYLSPRPGPQVQLDILRGKALIYSNVSEVGPQHEEFEEDPDVLGYPGPENLTPQNEYEELYRVDVPPAQVLEAISAQLGPPGDRGGWELARWECGKDRKVEIDPPGVHASQTYVRLTVTVSKGETEVVRRWLRNRYRYVTHQKAKWNQERLETWSGNPDNPSAIQHALQKRARQR